MFKVILTLVGTACLIGPALLYHYGQQVYFASYGTSYETEQVNKMLSSRTFYSLWKKKPMEPEKVAQILASSQDKALPETILGMFSVNQLLDLNNLDEQRCSDEEILRRQYVCERLKRAMNMNLHHYCEGCLKAFRDMCRVSATINGANRASDSSYDPSAPLDIDPETKKLLLTFSDEVLSLGKEFGKGHMTPKQLIEMVLAATPAPEKIKLQEACELLIEKMAERGAFAEGKITGWEVTVEYCASVKVLSEPARSF